MILCILYVRVYIYIYVSILCMLYIYIDIQKTRTTVISPDSKHRRVCIYTYPDLTVFPFWCFSRVGVFLTGFQRSPLWYPLQNSMASLTLKHHVVTYSHLQSDLEWMVPGNFPEFRFQSPSSLGFSDKSETP